MCRRPAGKQARGAWALLLAVFLIGGVGSACTTVDGVLLQPPPVDGTGAQGGDGDGDAMGDGDGDVAGDGDGDGSGGIGDGDATGDGDGDALPDGGVLDNCEVDPDVPGDPTCTRTNAETACYEGQCYVVECGATFRDCNLDPDDGCETPADSIEHCGACNQPCQRLGSTFDCVAGECIYQGCAEGFADCDDDELNGCEVETTTVRNCGACGTACAEPTMGTPACVEGACAIGECQDGFADCDGMLETGCEQSLSDVAHCGACDDACTPPGTSAGLCEQGQCRVGTCEADRFDCNGLGEDGCEATLDMPEHCGACGAACDLPNTATYICNAGTCEADTDGCSPGFGDCDGDPANGCEADLASLNHCGVCNEACAAEGAVTACTEGQCVVEQCEMGYALCGGDSCISLASNDDHCGTCNNACDTGAATPELCQGGVCSTVVCDPGTADCNNMTGDLCEQDLDVLTNCGACGVLCGPHENALSDCAGGTCSFTCAGSYRDCDGTEGNGCEVDIDMNLAHCGACDNHCGQLPGVDEATCGSGQCSITTCDTNRWDCNGNPADGCEVNFGQVATCGACDNDCTALPNTVNHGCNAGTCTFACADGFADCNDDPSDGCEANLADEATCGTCGNDCTALANTSGVACTAGACSNLVCTMGFDNCDMSVVNGCEESVQNVQSCGSCGTVCAPPNASDVSCPGGTCTIDTCEVGLGDCDNNTANGCETSIQNSSAHCGGCGMACEAGKVCNDGQCGCADDSQCANGETCCGGTCQNTAGRCQGAWCGFYQDVLQSQNCGGCGTVCGGGQLCCD